MCRGRGSRQKANQSAEGRQGQLPIWGNSGAHILWTLSLGGRDRRAQPPCGGHQVAGTRAWLDSKPQRDIHTGEGVNVCSVLGPMWPGETQSLAGLAG